MFSLLLLLLLLLFEVSLLDLLLALSELHLLVLVQLLLVLVDDPPLRVVLLVPFLDLQVPLLDLLGEPLLVLDLLGDDLGLLVLESYLLLNAVLLHLLDQLGLEDRIRQLPVSVRVRQVQGYAQGY